MKTAAKSYLVIFEKSATGYGAYVPDLPGCVATASTRSIAEELIQEGIAFHIEGLLLEGLPVPEPSTESTTFEIAIA